MKRKLGYVLVATGVLVLVFVGYRQFQNSNNHQSRNELRTALLENGIILDSISHVAQTLPRAADEHTTIQTKLDQNLTQINKQLAHYRNKSEASQIQNLVALEQKTLATYTKNVRILYKVLSYNPADDLGASAQNLSTRAQAASKGVGSLLGKDIGENNLSIVPGEISLSAAAHTALGLAQNCFDKLAGGTTSTKNCVQLYTTARQSLNSDLKDLWSSSELTRQRSAVDTIIERLR